MNECLVFTKIVYMSLVYLDFEDADDTGLPALREYVVFNDGDVVIRDREAKQTDFSHEEHYSVDPYDVATLFANIKRITECDKYDNGVLSLQTQTTDVRFEIRYSRNHYEFCPVLLCDDNGISIQSAFDGFIAYAKKEHTYYNWYEVRFSPYANKLYSYFYDDDSIKIGDHVIVPVGKNNEEKEAIVETFWRLSEEKLPYPLEKIKKIIRKIEPFSVDEFLLNTKFTRHTKFLFTDIDGFQYEGSIIGTYKDDPNAKEPYLKCFFDEGGILVNFVQSRISSIKRLKSR